MHTHPSSMFRQQQEVLKHLLHNLVHFDSVMESLIQTFPPIAIFLLSDGKLTVQQILKTYSAEPDATFLSACSTAECARPVDESIHIASAFLVFGFKLIIETL